MKHKEGFLILSLLLLAGLSIFLIGNGTTGNVTSTMYCEDGKCRDLCRFSTDCQTDEQCCSKGVYGVCEKTTNCQNFRLVIGDEVDSQEKPSPISSNLNIYLGAIFAIMAAGILFIYLSANHADSDEKKKS